MHKTIKSGSLGVSWPHLHALLLPMSCPWLLSLPYRSDIGGCPYLAHHFIDVLAKVGYIKNPASIFQVRVHQVCSEAFQHG